MPSDQSLCLSHQPFKEVTPSQIANSRSHYPVWNKRMSSTLKKESSKIAADDIFLLLSFEENKT